MNEQIHLNRKISKKSIELAKKYRYDLLSNQTIEEQTFAIILDSLDITHKKQKIFFTDDTFYIADFFIPKPYKIVIEIDGGCHLSTIQKDVKRTQFFECNRNFKVLRFPNNSVVANESFREEVRHIIESLKHHYSEYKNQGYSDYNTYYKSEQDLIRSRGF